MTDYGLDVACTDSMRTGRLVSGARLVAEAAYRRLITPRGSLRGGEAEANYGLDLAQLVGANVRGESQTWPDRIKSELLKDERIESLTVGMVETATGPTKSVSFTIEAETSEGPFELVLAVADLTVSLVGLSTGDA
jgi:hypothetical protein